MDVGVLGKLVRSKLIQDLESVSTKVITLGLQEVGGETGTSVTVVKGKSGREGRSGNTPLGGGSNNLSPAVLGLVNGVVEELVEEQVLELGVLAVGLGDLTQEDRSDNAATSPHESNAGIVELPTVLLTGLTDKHKALGVRDNLGGIKGLLEVVDKLLLVAVKLGAGATEDLRGSNTLVLNGRESSRKDSLTNEGHRGSKVKGVDGSPLTSTLLASSIKNLLNQGSVVLILEVQNVTGNLNQERVQDTSVPLGKDIGNLLVSKAGTTLKQIVGLANKLHVTVLNTIVDHLDVVASTGGADPVAAGLTVSLGSNVLEDGLDMGPGLRGTTGHERRTSSGTLFTTRDTRANKQKSLGLELFVAAVRVGEVRVTTVNDDITLLEVGLELSNEVVNSITGLDEQNNTAGSLEVGNELLNGVSANDGLALGLVLEEVVNLGNGSVVGDNGVAVVSGVKNEVLRNLLAARSTKREKKLKKIKKRTYLTHDGQTNKTDI